MPLTIRNPREGLDIATYTGNGGQQLIGSNSYLGLGALISNTIGNSLRLRSASSAYLYRTLVTPTIQSTYTLSLWFKRGKVGVLQNLFGVSTNHSLGINASNQLVLTLAGVAQATSTQLFMNCSEWVNIVYTQSGSTITLYADGNSVASGSATSAAFNTAVSHQIGAANNTNFTEGYVTHIAFVDGQALTPNYFGYRDTTTGIWLPISTSQLRANIGTGGVRNQWGANGFFAMFNDTPSAVTVLDRSQGDSATGGNDLSLTGVSATIGISYDWMLDTPTNNFVTFDPLYVSGGTRTLGFGNLYIAGSILNNNSNELLFPALPKTGKYYIEMICGSIGTKIGLDYNNCGYYSDGTLNGVNSYGATFTTTDVIGAAIDVDNGTVTFYKNGVSQGIQPRTLATSNRINIALLGHTTTPPYCNINCGQYPFQTSATYDSASGGYWRYAPPAGYKAISSRNFPSLDYSAYNVDFAFIKNRDAITDWVWIDSIRGYNKYLSSNIAGAETTNVNVINQYSNRRGCLTIGNDSKVNGSNYKYISYLFSAGNNPVSNTDGVITSTVAANKRTGISVVSFDFQAIASKTVGHGLGAVPKFIIVKSRNAAAQPQWICYHASIGNTGYVQLQSTGITVTTSTAWNNTSPTSTVFTLGSGFTTANYGTPGIAYCFAEVEGFSKIGSYTGNGNTDGPFVYCGFRPAVIIIKRTDAANSWIIYDYKRDPLNAPYTLVPKLNLDTTQAEDLDSNGAIDFLGNGFKLRSAGSSMNNASSGNYIFIAFAEAPQGGHFNSPSNAR
jgi:hypothetical protein